MSASQYVMQIVRVRLKDSAVDVLTKRSFDQVQEWLEVWTPQRNLKAVLAPTEGAALARLRKKLRDSLQYVWARHDVRPEMFEFEVSYQEAENDEFWMPSYLVWGYWHSIGDDE